MCILYMYLYIFICVVFYVYDYFCTFGSMECENKLQLQLQLPETNNVLTEQCGQDPKVRIQYFKYYDTLKRTS